MEIISEQKMNEKEKDNLLSDVLLGYLEQDDLQYSVANTRLLQKYNDGLITSEELVSVYNFILGDLDGKIKN